MFDLDKKAQSDVLDEIMYLLKEKGKDRIGKLFASPEDVLGKGKVNVSEKTYIIPFGKKHDDENKESLMDDVDHYEDIYKDDFDDVDNDNPYDGKFEDRKKEFEKEDEIEDAELSEKEKKLLELLKKS